MEASNAISELIAITKYLHRIAENLVPPYCRKRIRIMIGKEPVKQVERVQFSKNIVSRRTDDICCELSYSYETT